MTDMNPRPRRIEILPDHVANQIAAGEVVERPASVVKELVENALDAGASRVEVSLRNGGKTEIRVADDGVGMEHRDALLAVDRHATSKIRRLEDLRGVSSFGFRGEALSSIAAVSRFDLETAPAGGGRGTHLRVAGGRILDVKEIARRPGTTLTVRALFQNIPARARFLRSAAVETRAACEAVILLALSHLSTAFRLESNGRELLDLPAAASLGGRVADIWDRALAAELIAIDETRPGLRVAGLIQRPVSVRPAGGRRFLFVGGRPFRDRGMLRVVDDAYRTTVAPDLRPTVFLYLALPAGRVDVNVHPTKTEVRFEERERVLAAVSEVIRAALGRLESAARVHEVGGTPEGEDVLEAGRGVHAATGGVATGAGAATAPPAAPASETPAQLAMFVPRAAAAEPVGENGLGGGALQGLGPGLELDDGRPQIWQLHRSYLIAETRDGLLIVDQHSAHERVLFEEAMKRFSEGKGVSQRLLFPITLHLSAAEYAAAEELAGLLRRQGFEIEPFGERTAVVHATPNPHPYFDPERCIREMIRELATGSALVDSARNQHEKIAKSLACKGAIKAGQALSTSEMTELFDRLFATELPGHDVHGRPTILRLTLTELARRFGRT